MRTLPLEFDPHKNVADDYLNVIRKKLLPLLLPLLTGATVALGIALGYLATEVSLEMGIMALGGIVVLLLAFYKPEFVILLMVMMNATIFSIGERFFGFSPIHYCAFLLLGIVVLRIFSTQKEYAFVHTPLDWPFLLFFVGGTVSALNAIYNLGTISDFRNPSWKIFITFLVFFAVTNLVRTRRQLMTLLGGMLVMATIVAIFMIVQQVIGTSANILPGSDTAVNEAKVLGKTQTGVARVSTSAAVIVFTLFLPVLILHATPEFLKNRKWLTFIPLIVFPMAIAFTFDRNMWIATALGGLIYISIAHTKSVRLISALLILVLGAVLMISLLDDYFPRIDNVTAAIVNRFDSLFAGNDLVNDSSTQWRLMENEYAIPVILDYPVLGIGPHAEYRPPIRKPVDNITHYIHNGYLWILLDFGIVGFLPLLWFSIAHLVMGFRSWYTLHDPVLRALVIGLTVSYVGLLISNVVAPRFLTIHGSLLAGIILGMSQVAIRLGRQVDNSARVKLV